MNNRDEKNGNEAGKKEKILSEWEEAVGAFESIEHRDADLIIHLTNCELAFSRLSPEAKTIGENLSENDVGKEISILRTDMKNCPLLILKEPANETFRKS